MKWRRSKGYRCVTASTPEEFEEKVNIVMRQYPGAKMEIDIHIPLMCHAWYDTEVLTPECKADEYELKGDIHYCIECPYLDRPRNSNRNQKRFPCEFANWGMTFTSSPCCDKYYDWMEQQNEERSGKR